MTDTTIVTEIAELRRVVSVKSLVWKEDHGVAILGPYRLFEAETALGRYVYGTDAEGACYYHAASSGVYMVGNEAKAKQLAEDAWEKAALSEIGKYASRALPAAPDVGDEKRVKVPEGQTPLDDNLDHRYLAVLDEGSRARDSGEGSPYHGHSLEHCLHATGWVSRDLRLALNKAHEDSKTIREQARRDAYAKCRSVIGRHYRATVTAPDGDDHTYGMRLTLNSVDCEIEALAEAKS